MEFEDVVSSRRTPQIVNWLVDEQTTDQPRSPDTWNILRYNRSSFRQQSSSEVFSSAALITSAAFACPEAPIPKLCETSWSSKSHYNRNDDVDQTVKFMRLTSSLINSLLPPSHFQERSPVNANNVNIRKPWPPLIIASPNLTVMSVPAIRFQCRLCAKGYTTLGAVRLHSRTHTLPCRCSVCGKAFSRPWLLRGHWRTHTGERPFQCPDTECRRAFADRSNLRAHLQTHVDVKKYGCVRCAKTFSRVSLLVKHKPACHTMTSR